MKAALYLWLFSLGLVIAQDCAQLKEATPRGLQCLHCTHPKAEKAALALVEPLLNSCLKNVALGFVLDSSFGNNFEIISKMTQILTENNRHVFLHFYFLSGPAQRRYADKVFPDSVFLINPYEFREKIKNNRKFQDTYSNFVASFSEMLSTLESLGVTISIAPMLEDNFDNASFQKIMELTKAALSNNSNITFVRSSCRDCFSGNEFEIPSHVAREEHRGDTSFSFSNGIISNDGWGYIKFPGDKLTSIFNPVSHSDKRIEKIMTLAELKKSLIKASAKNNMFLLWLSKYQVTLPGNKSIPVNKRKYPMPKKRELLLIQKFLQ